MPPRPILKARLSSFTQRSPASPSSSSSPNTPPPFASSKPSSGLVTPHVHFPPTPAIASTQPTHSSSIYDRTAIAVSPNCCELPERGGRCYSPSYVRRGVSRVSVNSYFDPQAVKACDTAPDASSPPPPLVADTSSSSSSSESDESDAGGHTSSACSIPSTFSQEQFIHALSFLPHPPSPVKAHNHPRPKLQRKSKFWEQKKGYESSAGSRLKPDSSFGEESLDGCLGGF
ncbi:hypothetical protein C8R42DRAFT_612739 [Lentinula raphanica]|nr:hypothetical protein C8R42DRAFT_612739 [Lentinula raphanica]